MEKFFLSFLLAILPCCIGKAHAVDASTPTETKEQLIEETLLQHYSSKFLQITKGKPYYCQKIMHISNFDNEHMINVSLITFEGAHNPPYDLYIITFLDKPGINMEEPFEFILKNVAHAENISIKQAQSVCK